MLNGGLSPANAACVAERRSEGSPAFQGRERDPTPPWGPRSDAVRAINVTQASRWLAGTYPHGIAPRRPSTMAGYCSVPGLDETGGITPDQARRSGGKIP
jgi:hypothetical protein